MIYILPYTLVDQYNEFEWKKKIKQKRLFDITAPSFWYLHGAIERHFHYDGAYMFVDEETKEKHCTEINGLLTLNEGIYDVTVEQYSEQYGHPCKAYIFHRQSDKVMLLIQLIKVMLKMLKTSTIIEKHGCK